MKRNKENVRNKTWGDHSFRKWIFNPIIFFLDRLAFWKILQEKCFEVLESPLDQRS